MGATANEIGDVLSVRALSDTNLIDLELTNFNINIMRMGVWEKY